MLDFYLIGDDVPQPLAPDGLEHVGKMEYYHFQRLQGLHLLDSCLDFYHDFRIPNKQVEHKYDLFKHLDEAEKEAEESPATAEAIFLKMLQRAQQSGSGIIAFSS